MRRLDRISSIRRMNERLRADRTWLDHRFVKILRSLHMRALIEVV